MAFTAACQRHMMAHVTVVAQTNYFFNIVSYFVRKPLN